MKILAEIKNDAQAMVLYKDWLGDGLKPVSSELALKRSRLCLHGGENQSKCPKNIAGHWWDEVKHKVADVIKQQIRFKNKMSLHLPEESELFMCSACGCAMPVKCWVPIKHIKEHTDPDQLKAFTSFCWIPKEIQEMS